MQFKSRALCLILAVSMGVSTVANAGWMSDFYTSAGSAMNATPGGSIATQSVVGYSGGGVTWRIPNKTLYPFNITPPSFSAGCNGIDAYLGSFSMVNKNAFVQALRNFGQQSVGYFFQLALRSMAPEIAVTLDVINDLAQKANQFGKNSCEAAHMAVDSIAGDWMKRNKRDAQDSIRATGAAIDDWDAGFTIGGMTVGQMLNEKYKQMYGVNQGSQTAIQAASNEPPPNVNMLWWMLSHADSSGLTTQSDKEIMMSLIGTDIIISNGNTQIPKSKPRTIEFKDLVGDQNQTSSTFMVLRCDEVIECLNPTPTATSDLNFSAAARALSDRIKTAVLVKQTAAFSSLDLSILALSSVPLYRASAMAGTSALVGAAADQLRQDLAEYTALDAALNLVNYHAKMLEKATDVGNEGGKIVSAKTQEYKSRIRELQAAAHREVQGFYAKRGDPLAKIEQLDKIERSMYTNLNLRLAANAHFGRR